MLYPEGTRYNSKTLARSQQFCKERNMKVLEHVLVPRTKVGRGARGCESARHRPPLLPG